MERPLGDAQGYKKHWITQNVAHKAKTIPFISSETVCRLYDGQLSACTINIFRSRLRQSIVQSDVIISANELTAVGYLTSFRKYSTLVTQFEVLQAIICVD